MFDTLRALLDRGGPDAKAVVWAHNSHIGNAAATAMGWQGEFNIGELCRTAFGEARRCSASAPTAAPSRPPPTGADRWRSSASAPPCPAATRRCSATTGVPRALLDLRARDDVRAALAGPRLERAIGVVYRPDTERQSHYFDAVLPEQFDAFVWFEETAAVSPLAEAAAAGAASEPDTFPFGL